MFGKSCRVRKYQDRARGKLTPQCFNCNGFDHKGKPCERMHRCGLCGKPHTELEHTLQCEACQAEHQMSEVEFTEESLKSGLIGTCKHNLHCVNCAEKGYLEIQHRADSQQCPERTRQIGSVRDNNRAPTEAPTNNTNDTQPSRKQQRKKQKRAKAADQPQAQGVPTGNAFAPLSEESLGPTTQLNTGSNMGDVHA